MQRDPSAHGTANSGQTVSYKAESYLSATIIDIGCDHDIGFKDALSVNMV